MCIDIYEPGFCLNVQFLLDQVWFRASSDPEHPERLDVTEVYDVCLYNPLSNDTLSSVHLLFPHDCLLEEGGKLVPQVFPYLVSTVVAREQRPYNWHFRQPQERTLEDGSRQVCRPFPADASKPLPDNFTYLWGKQIRGTIMIPASLPSSHVEALARTKTTLVQYDFPETALKGGEMGWIRLLVKPVKRAGSPPREKLFPLIPLPFEFEQWRSVTCPMIVRDLLGNRLKDPKQIPATEDVCASLLDTIFAKGVESAGTVTRIEDHRVGMVSGQSIGIYEPTGAGSVDSFGRVGLAVPPEYFASLWNGGSVRNRDRDLVHLMIRVVDRLAEGEIGEDSLVQSLAPSGKHEAFSILVKVMVEKRIIQRLDNGVLGLILEDGWRRDTRMTDLEPRFSTARKFYRSRQVMRTENPEEQRKQSLYHEFRDVHPFRIDFRVTWSGESTAFRQWKNQLLAVVPSLGSAHKGLTSGPGATMEAPPTP